MEEHGAVGAVWGVGPRGDVQDHCYKPMDRLLERQPAIQKALAKQHLQEGCLVQWHVQQRLKPLFAKDGKGKNRQWTFSTVMERLKALRRQRMKVGGVEFEQVAEPEEDQKEIIELLKAKKP